MENDSVCVNLWISASTREGGVCLSIGWLRVALRAALLWFRVGSHQRVATEHQAQKLGGLAQSVRCVLFFIDSGTTRNVF